MGRRVSWSNMLKGALRRITSRRWVRHFFHLGFCDPSHTHNAPKALILWRRPYRSDRRPLPFLFGILEVCDYNQKCALPDKSRNVTASGQREFVNMLPLVCNDAVAILFMFDLSRKSTLNSVKEWYRQARGFNKVCIYEWESYVRLTSLLYRRRFRS